MLVVRTGDNSEAVPSHRLARESQDKLKVFIQTFGDIATFYFKESLQFKNF